MSTSTTATTTTVTSGSGAQTSSSKSLRLARCIITRPLKSNSLLRRLHLRRHLHLQSPPTQTPTAPAAPTYRPTAATLPKPPILNGNCNRNRCRLNINMSLDPPTYLASLQSNIRQRPIPWDGAVRAGTLTEEQHAQIRAVDKAKKLDQRKQIVTDDLDGYTALFVGTSGKPSVLETAGKHPNVIQYILVLLADLLEGECSPSQNPTCRKDSHHKDNFLVGLNNKLSTSINLMHKQLC